MSRAARVVERFEDLPPGLKRKVIEALAKGTVKLPLIVVEDGGVAARLGYDEITRAVRENWRRIAAAKGIHVHRDPIAIIETPRNENYNYTLKVVLPCSFIVEFVVIEYTGEAELFVNFTKWH